MYELAPDNCIVIFIFFIQNAISVAQITGNVLYAIISGAYYHLMDGNEITLLILSYFCITFRTSNECRAQLVVQKQYRR